MKTKIYELINAPNRIINRINLFALFVALLSSFTPSLAQSFKKGSLLIGISEGATNARYTTSDLYTHQIISDEIIKGDRDPIQIEYGITRQWGISLSCGNDIFKVNPQKSYKYGSETLMKSKTSECLIEGNYHFFVTDKWDMALFAGVGNYKVELFDKNSKCLNEGTVVYNKGKITRGGIKVRYYVLKRLSVLGMLSVFNAYAQDDGNNYSSDIYYNRIATNTKGITLEFGLSYRILK